MSEGESGTKRVASEEDINTTQIEHNKKQKIDNEVGLTETTLPTLSTTLVLDKVQEDTINQLVQESTAVSTVEVMEPKNTESKPEENTNKIMEQEIESADIKTTVTPETIIHEVVEQQEKTSNEPADDLNITSEQLLFALTSVPPAESTTSGTKEESVSATTPISTPAVAMDIDPNEEDKSVIVKELLAPVTPDQPTVPVTEKEASNAPPSSSSTISTTTPIITNTATTSNNVPTGLGITPIKSTPPSQPASASPLPTSNTTNSTATTTASQPKANSNTNNNPALTNALTNLPDISAALRRLSSHSVPASVIEQLSSSPRIPNILNERRTSSSPSEILGNALAAVAANAAAASRSSPKQPQPQTNAATAIGNLAAITANISNLLHSGGFHRNSFSQEDTQKLAAAVAVARNGQQQQQQQQQQAPPAPQTSQQRRKSSMANVGNAFSNMMEMIGRNNNNTKAPTSTVVPAATPAPLKPKLIIKNEQVWKSLEGVEEKRLGFQLYSPQLVLPNLEANLNGIMEIRVPARYLTFENIRVKKRAIWGTDIYTDDSDVVAMAIHSGKYEPVFVEPDVEAGDPFTLAVAGKQRESIEAAKKLALSGKKWVRHDNLIPDYDLQVTVRVLPTLQHYASCTRHRIKSREWAKHDGMSLFVNKVEKIKRGEARLRGRSTIKSNIFAYEQYRKEALGLTSSHHHKPTTKNIDQKTISNDSTSKPSFHYPNCRVKKTRRVMRMFQIRSEMSNTSNKDMMEE